MDYRADLLNYVANQPEVLAFAAAPGVPALDLTAFFRNPNNRMFGDELGVVIFVQESEDVYRAYMLFTADCRGRDALRVMRKALRGMFTSGGARVIIGTTPREYRAARAMIRALHAKPTGDSIDGYGRNCIDYVLERAEWAKKNADA
jgi:hypothetical protein